MKEELAEILFNAVNEQGYLFSEACADLMSRGRTGWDVVAEEYPVTLATEDTRIDIVLRTDKCNGVQELYGIVECKRADPQYVCWLFGSPGAPEYANCLGTNVEHAGGSSDKTPDISIRQSQIKFKFSTYSAKWWLEVKKQKATAKKISSPDNIESAFIQVLKGLEGFTQEQYNQRRKGHVSGTVAFIPVVITTAPLFVAEYDPKNINLANGRIAKNRIYFGSTDEPTEEVEWILVHYGAGTNVIPQLIPEEYYSTYPADLLRYKTRSIFVVNSNNNNIESFFSKLCL